ncbi:hypothetical protein BOTBODRAFT_412702 [Botryobasidium botryosum FD-172 SS1]|uniref:Uncharacterized protein n=1 Tax=Botryobasidium botryosum (strain FD-172 SS1) TaxID=930990 RepID=A0A067M9Y6_BOTB1|nr:hypothetical protein BOTBODRAFT_412702 [Botryobasidium botryosum FD-172 SS1]
MTPAQQVLYVGTAAVVVAANAFWMPGRASQIKRSLEHCIQSGMEESVRVMMLQAFQGSIGSYDTPAYRVALLQICLANQSTPSASPIIERSM